MAPEAVSKCKTISATYSNFATTAESAYSTRVIPGYVGDTPRTPMKGLPIATNTNSTVTVN